MNETRQAEAFVSSERVTKPRGDARRSCLFLGFHDAMRFRGLSLTPRSTPSSLSLVSFPRRARRVLGWRSHALGELHHLLHGDGALIPREIVILGEEEHAVTLFALAHGHAGAVPEPGGHLRLLVVVVAARAQGAPRVSLCSARPWITTAVTDLSMQKYVSEPRAYCSENLRITSRFFSDAVRIRAGNGEGQRRRDSSARITHASPQGAEGDNGASSPRGGREGRGRGRDEGPPRRSNGILESREGGRVGVGGASRARVAVAAANERGTATGHVCQDNRTRRGWEGEIPRGAGRRFADGDVRRGARWRNRRGESVTYPRR